MGVEAILLAAGQGKRFGGALAQGCKVLIEVHGECLLDRHVDALLAGGVDKLHVVVGFEGQRIEQRLRERAAGKPWSLIWNERFREGSLHSLYCARDVLTSGRTTVVMDADVLYDPRLIPALLRDSHPSGLLFDPGFLDEEMKVGLRGGVAAELGKKIRAEDYEGIGRGPGFYKLDPQAGGKLAAILCDMVNDGLSGLEYEDALTRLFAIHPVHPVGVGAMAWTEIDHAQDLARAENEIWPRLPHPQG